MTDSSRSANSGAEGDRASSDQVSQNIDAVAAIIDRAERTVNTQQRAIERTAAFLGRPVFLATISALIVLWIAANSAATYLGWHPVDPPPFEWLQGVVTVAALYTTLVVISTQNRQAKVSEQRDHLELQAILLTEQKTTKLISLLEELRRDLPNVHDRTDAEAQALQLSLDPDTVLSALEEKLDMDMEAQ